MKKTCGKWSRPVGMNIPQNWTIKDDDSEGWRSPPWDFPPQTKSKTPAENPRTASSSFALNAPPISATLLVHSSIPPSPPLQEPLSALPISVLPPATVCTPHLSVFFSPPLAQGAYSLDNLEPIVLLDHSAALKAILMAPWCNTLGAFISLGTKLLIRYLCGMRLEYSL